MPTLRSQASGAGLAVLAETLYLVNLLLLPGIAFLGLAWLRLRCFQRSPPLARCHIQQTLSAGIWAGVLLVAVVALIVLAGGRDGPWTWVIVVVYFTVCHSTLVLLGAFGLSRALAGRCWRFPLVGRPLPPGCD